MMRWANKCLGRESISKRDLSFLIGNLIFDLSIG
jgi:hypothetical protein